MTSISLNRALPALLAVALFALLAGSGSDSSGEDSTTNAVSIPSPTSPMATTTTPSTTGGGKKQGQTTTANTRGSVPCSIPDACQDFKYTGLDCSAAVAVAQACDASGKTCNTVDNPESPIGPQ